MERHSVLNWASIPRSFAAERRTGSSISSEMNWPGTGPMVEVREAKGRDR